MNGEIIVKVGADIADFGRDLAKATNDIKDFGKSASDGLSDAAKAAGVYVDASGRLREANGRFVSDARKAELGLQNFGNESKNASQKLSDFSTNLQSTGQQIAGTFGSMSLAVGGGLTYAVNKAADFDTAMRKAGAIAGASSEDLEAMRQSAIELGASTSESASSVATAMQEMAAKGYDANQIIAAMPGVISAAEASGEDLAIAADTVASALNIFGLEADQSTRVADILAESANSTAAGITDLQFALKYAGAPAAALGISLEETTAAIGLMTNAGLDGSSAGTALRASLLALNNPAKEQEKIMEGLGVSLYDSQGKMKSISGIVAELTKATEGMTEADKTATIAKLVGTEATSGFLALMSAGPKEIDKMTAALEDSEGASAATAKEMKAGIGGALEELSGTVESAAILLGDQLVPYVQKAAVFITNLINKFNELSPAMQKWIAVGAAVFAGLTGIVAVGGVILMFIGGLATAISALMGFITPLLVAIAEAGGIMAFLSAKLAALGGAFSFLIGPVGIAIAAITGIVAAFVIAYNKVEWFRVGVLSVWQAIKDFTVTVFTAIYQTVSGLVSSLVDFVKGLLDKFGAFWNENGAFISSVVQFYFNSIWSTIKMVLGFIKGIFEVVWPQISAVVKVVWELIQLTIENALDLVLGIIQSIMKLIQGDWEGAWDSIKGIAEDIMNNIIGFFEDIDLVEIGKDIIRGLIKGIGDMFGAVKEKVASLADNLPGWLKDKLGIHSPSRVLNKEVGKWIPLGMAEGITRNINAVRTAAQSMAEAAIPSISDYSAPVNISGSMAGAVDAMESRIQAQFDEADANRGDLVLVMDAREVARAQKPYIDSMQSRSLKLTQYNKGVR